MASWTRPLIVLLFATSALAADRHVFRDTPTHCSVTTGTSCSTSASCPAGEYCVGDGILNDCPNPGHNHNGSAGNTANLTYCATGADAGKIIGTCSNCVSSCAGGVTPSNVVSGSSVYIDSDASLETVYTIPQACIWNMNQSDSCEIHAGTYQNPGARALSTMTHGDAICDRSDCWLANFVAYGYGATIGTGGYGVLGSPGYIRGAVMNGVTDTWDCDGDKTPYDAETETGCAGISGTNTYSAILSGNSDGDGTPNEATLCDTAKCTGDAFFGFQVGCGNDTDVAYCNTPLGAGETRTMIDTDGDGTFDTASNSGGWRNVSYLTIKDLEFSGHGGGPTTCADVGVRGNNGNLGLLGGGRVAGYGDGLVVDHIYFHDNTYGNICRQEHYVTVFADDENYSCSRGYTEIKNSYINNKNRFVINDDCDALAPGASECGCGKSLHDNRIILSQTATDSRTDGSGNTYLPYQQVWRLKSIDTLGGSGTKRAKGHLTYNNEIIIQNPNNGSPGSGIFYMECFGSCDPDAIGQGYMGFWGNIVRVSGGATATFTRFAFPFCGTEGNGDHWTFTSFNNTFDQELNTTDSTSTGGPICTNTGFRAVSRNNAFFRATSVNQETATTIRRANDVCTQSSQTSCTQPSQGNARTTWWTVGTKAVGINSGLANYVPACTGTTCAGPLYQNGSCDPDGDGVAGVDYDGDGVNDTTWTDIRGSTISCPTVGSTINIGAIQTNLAAAASCPNGTRELAEVCDRLDLNSQTCISQGFAGGTLGCCDGETDTAACLTSTCAAFDTGNCTIATTRSATMAGVTCSGGCVVK